MALNRKIVLGAGAAAVAAAIGLGVVPDSPGLADRECYRALVVAPCALAKSLAADASEMECVSGEATVPVEIVIDKGAADAPASQLPEGVDAIGESLQQIDCAQARRPSKVLTTRALPLDDPETCIAGLVSIDVSAAGDGSSWRTWTEPHSCSGARCRCDNPPCVRIPCHEIAGRPTWRARWCEARPTHPKCQEAAP